MNPDNSVDPTPSSVFCEFHVEASDFEQFQSVQFKRMRHHKLDFKVRARHPFANLFESGDIGRDVLRIFFRRVWEGCVGRV